MTENIGARRLHTVMERLLEDVSFEAPDDAPPSVVVGDAKAGKAYFGNTTQRLPMVLRVAPDGRSVAQQAVMWNARCKHNVAGLGRTNAHIGGRRMGKRRLHREPIWVRHRAFGKRPRLGDLSNGNRTRSFTDNGRSLVRPVGTDPGQLRDVTL